jgi:hypothetical protein
MRYVIMTFIPTKLRMFRRSYDLIAWSSYEMKEES